MKKFLFVQQNDLVIVFSLVSLPSGLDPTRSKRKLIGAFSFPTEHGAALVYLIKIAPRVHDKSNRPP